MALKARLFDLMVILVRQLPLKPFHPEKIGRLVVLRDWIRY